MIKSYKDASASLQLNGGLSESFGVGVRQECVMSPWLFDIHINGCMEEMKVRKDFGVRLRGGGLEQPVMACQFVDDTVMSAESERMLQVVVDSIGFPGGGN